MPDILRAGSYTQSAFALPIGAVAALALVVGVWVVWHERRRPVSMSFLAATLAIAVYLAGFSFMVRSATYPVALFWGRFAYVGIPFIVPAVYQFSMDLLGLRERRTAIIAAAWVVGAIYMVLAVGSDVLVAGVFRTGWGFITRITGWTYLILGWSTALVTLALLDYYREYRRAGEVQKARIRLFAIPILIGSLAFIDYAPSLGYPIGPWGFVVFAFFLISAAWAVARYHLPDLTPAFAATQIARTMAEPLLVCDDQGAVAFANPSAAGLLGWSEAELVGARLDQFMDADDARSLLQDETVRQRELLWRSRTGGLIDMAVSTSRIEAKRGRQVGTIVVGRDIRAKKAAAREIERRERRFRALIENARDTITIVDEAGDIIYESPAVERVLGLDTTRSPGASLFDRIHPEDRERMREHFATLLEGPDSRVEAEARVLDAAGRARTLEFAATNLLETPAVGGIVINARDVTEERRLDEELKQAHKMEAVGRLAGGVAHDFNNILTAVQLNVALLLEALDPDSPLRSELVEIRRGAERAGRLTEQLLAFSRRQVVQPRVVDLNRIVSEMRDMLVRLIGANIHLETHLSAQPATVRVDRGQIDQVLLNLVVNARDAVDGDGRIDLSVATTRVAAAEARAVDFPLEAGEYVVLKVSDNGRGMDGETRSRLFEPFFTTKEAGKGTGLGLSTVYGAVRQADGHIGVTSAPGRGSTFSVYLPRVDPELHQDEPEEPAPASESAVSGGVVLVVEDEAAVRQLMARVLKREGYEVLVAADGEAGIAAAARHDGAIDLLIADLVMPGLSGREVAERLGRDRPGTAVIFISGYTADEVVRQGVSEGEHHFLPKPFTPDQLSREVAAALRHRGAG